MKQIQSKQGTVSKRDGINGFLIGLASAAVWAVIEFAQNWLAGGNDIFDIEGKDLLRVAIAGLVAYLGKNLFEPSKVGTIEATGKEARQRINGQKV